jgi:hypothetical protein
LRDVSLKIDEPKVLLTGKPIYVDGEYNPGVSREVARQARREQG